MLEVRSWKVRIPFREILLAARIKDDIFFS
jgi:hypothetical protein